LVIGKQVKGFLIGNWKAS